MVLTAIAHDFLSALEFLPSDAWTFNNVERRIRRENAAPRGNYFFSKANCSKRPGVAAYIPENKKVPQRHEFSRDVKKPGGNPQPKKALVL